MFTIKNKLSNGGLLTAVALSLIISSCQKDDFSTLKDPTWSPELAIPLVNSSLTIHDLVHSGEPGTVLLVDSSQFATLVYHGQTMQVDASSLVDIPSNTSNMSISMNSAEILALNSTGQVTIPVSVELDLFDGQGMEIDSILFKSGSLSMELATDIPGDITLNFDIPDLTEGHNPVSAVLISSHQNGSGATSIELSNKKADLTRSQAGFNAIRINGSLTISNLQSPATAPCIIQLSASMINGKYSSIFGYFGSSIITHPRDTINISVFENSINSGSFTIADPSVEFTLNNSLGIPLKVTLPEVVTQTSASLYPVSGIPNPIPVISPELHEIGQSKTTGFELDSQNSNVSSLISSQPRFIFTQARMTTNPAGPDKNFVTDSSRLTVDIRVDLPLYGTASDFRIRDTLPFSYKDLQNVESLELKAIIENGFPLESNIQVLFTDENYQLLDSLFIPGEIIIASGVVDPISERVIMPGRKTTSTTMERNRLMNLLNAQHLIVQSRASTTNNGNNVKLFADYNINIKISTKAKLIIQ